MLAADDEISVKFEAALSKEGNTKVDLSLTDLRCEGADKVALAVHDFPTISELDISCNSILADGTQRIASILLYPHCSALNTLNISANFIGDAGALDLVTALKHNTTLMHLDAHSCGIYDEGAIAFAELISTNSSLMILSLRANYIADKGALALAEAIPKNNGLYEINLHGNDFKKVAGEALIASMTGHSSIQSHGKPGAGLDCQVM